MPFQLRIGQSEGFYSIRITAEYDHEAAAGTAWRRWRAIDPHVQY